MKLTGKLSIDVEKVKQKLKSEDIVFLDIKAGNSNGVIIFAKDLVDKTAIGDLILRPLSKVKGKITKKTITENFLSPELKTVTSIEQIIEEVVMAKAVFICNGIVDGYSFAFEKFEKELYEYTENIENAFTASNISAVFLLNAAQKLKNSTLELINVCS